MRTRVCRSSFNSSIGILSVRTPDVGRGALGVRHVSIPRSEFFRFGPARAEGMAPVVERVSIPRSEFFRFGLQGMLRRWLEEGVSIPRSEFFRFGPSIRSGLVLRLGCFNSSIGILSVRTARARRVHVLFQAVSIPRSEFFRFGHSEQLARNSQKLMFQFLDRNSFGSDLVGAGTAGDDLLCFNSSIGILSVRTTGTATPPTTASTVSIPRSEFFRFGRRCRWW